MGEGEGHRMLGPGTKGGAIGVWRGARALLVAHVAMSRQTGMAVWACAVIVGWAVVALAVLLASVEFLTFQPVAHPAAIGWVTVHAYPKHQETVYFVLAVLGVPACAVAGWWTWVAVSVVLSRLGRITARTALYESAIALLPLFAPLPRLVRFDPEAWRLLGWSGVTTVALLTLLCGWHRLRAPAVVLSANSAPAANVADPASTVPSGHRVWRLLLWVPVSIGLPVILYALKHRGHVDGAVDLFHEGEFLVPLNEMLRGAVPYRDMHLQHGLFYNAWIPWLGSRLFGPTLEGVRLIRHAVDPLGACAGLLMVLALFRARIVSALAFACLACGAGFSVPSRGALGFLAIAVAGAAIGGRHGLRILDGCEARPAWRRCVAVGLREGWALAAAGFVAMLAFWHSVEIGIYSLTALGAFLGIVGLLQPGIAAWRRPMPLLCLAAGAGLGFWSVGWYLVWRGALVGLVRTVYLQCAHQTETWGLPFPKFFNVVRPLQTWPVAAKWPESFTRGGMLWYLPVGLFVALGVALVFRWARGGLWNRPASLRLLLLFLSACCYFRTVLGRSDGVHLEYGVLFMVLVAMVPADQALGAAWHLAVRPRCRWRRRALAIPCLALAALLAWPVNTYVQAAFRPSASVQACWKQWREPRRRSHAAEEPVARAGLVALGGQADKLREVSAAIRARTPGGEAVFDFSNQAALLFFADRPSATRYFEVAYASTDATQREVIADLERQQTPLVIWRGGSGYDAIDGVPQARRHPLIHAYVESHYEPDIEVRGVVLYRRKAAGCAFR